MQGGAYRKTPFRLPTKGWCDFVRTDVLMAPDLLPTTNFPQKDVCPFPAVKIFVILNF